MYNFVLKSANTPKPKNTQGWVRRDKNVLLPLYCIVLSEVFLSGLLVTDTIAL